MALARGMSATGTLATGTRVAAVLVTFGLGLAVPAPASARPAADPRAGLRPMLAEDPAHPSPLVGRSLSSGLYSDTTYYGGTVWAPDSNRWEAIRGGTWTFDSGVGSSLVTAPGGCKPVGYHQQLEGWTGVDRQYEPQPYFRPSSICPIQGSFSCLAGLSAAEANPRCYVAGQGYGNLWNMTVQRTFNYPGSGSVTLNFAYRVEAEPDFDYLYVNVDTTGAGSQDDVNLVGYTGNVSGTAMLTLTPGINLRSTPGPITIKFNVTSDGAYSDEDGGYATTCGHSAIDNIALGGAITTPAATFETGDDGWLQVIPACGSFTADFSDIRHLADLPPPLSFCPCALSDSVLVFMDTAGTHGEKCQDNIVLSPWIDLRAGGDVGRPGKVIEFDGYFDLPLTNYTFVQTVAQWYPYHCSNGTVTTSPLTSDGFLRYFNGAPSCTTPGSPQRVDFSAVIPPEAEQVRIGVGIYMACCFVCCDFECHPNATPWFDNIRLGVYGSPGAPLVTMRPTDVFQDAFAADGTLNPASTARVDVNNVKGASRPAPGTALGDTLVVGGDGGNQEVRVVFRVRTGPFTGASALNAWAAARWTPEPSLGAGWYSARMDTAEQAGVVTSNPRRWMGTLHEADPKFGGGTDRDRGAEGDNNQLSHDIFPDHIFTPGSRIDYFVKARYLPPDPRNPGGTNWYVLPDTTGHNFLEMEVLPSSMAADSTWNCTLLVDHHADRDVDGGRLEEAGLAAALGGGGSTPEGTRYDRWDVNASTSQQASLGRPQNTEYGASIEQIFGYRTVVWHSGSNPSYNLVDEDAAVLVPFLVGSNDSPHRFWGSGDGLVRSMETELEPTTLTFLHNVLGVRYLCDSVRLLGCPGGSVLDSTACLPLADAAGAEFAAASPGSVRGNGCPGLRNFDLIERDPSLPLSRGQLDYVKAGAPASFASLTRNVTGTLDFRSVVDAFADGALRDLNGDPHVSASCTGTAAVGERASLVLDWLQSGLTGACRFPGPPCPDCGPSDVPEPSGPAAIRLQRATPNPTSGTTEIAYTLGTRPGTVRLQLFDISGRLVRTLVDEAQPAGAHSVTWDGRDAAGRAVSAGMYFYRLAAGGVIRSGRLIVRR